MKKLTTIAALLKRVRRKPELAACAIAALLFLAALHAPARAQNTYGGATVVHDGFIGVVAGQTVSVTVPNSYFQNGSVRFLKHSIKVYEIGFNGITERESGLVYSGESGGLNEASHEYGHTFTLSYSDLPVQGEPRTGRKEVWIEVESFPPPATQDVDSSAVVLSPTIELIDDRSGKTVVFGLLLPAIMKVGSARPATSAVSIEGGTGCIDTEVGRVCPLSVGVAAGQTVRIVFRSTNDIDSFPTPSRETDLIVAAEPSSGGQVKVFNTSTGALLCSRELTDLTSGFHTIDINRDELTEAGSPGTGRIQLWIVLGGMKVSLTTFEVFDNESGKTTVSGSMNESMETMKKASKDPS